MVAFSALYHPVERYRSHGLLFILVVDGRHLSFLAPRSGNCSWFPSRQGSGCAETNSYGFSNLAQMYKYSALFYKIMFVQGMISGLPEMRERERERERELWIWQRPLTG